MLHLTYNMKLITMDYRKAIHDKGYKEEFRNGRSGSGTSRYYLIKPDGKRATRLKATQAENGQITVKQEYIMVNFTNGHGELSDVIYNTGINTAAGRALRDLYSLIPVAEKEARKLKHLEKMLIKQ